jgi:hypothetical protein
MEKEVLDIFADADATFTLGGSGTTKAAERQCGGVDGRVGVCID